MVKDDIKSWDPYETPAVEKARKMLLEEFTGTAFQIRVEGDHKF
jgi:hypothetical protein